MLGDHSWCDWSLFRPFWKGCLPLWIASMSVCNAIIILFWSVTADPTWQAAGTPKVKLIDRGPAGVPPALQGFEVWTQDLFNAIIAKVFLFPPYSQVTMWPKWYQSRSSAIGYRPLDHCCISVHLNPYLLFDTLVHCV
jgi:hypothetical protein